MGKKWRGLSQRGNTAETEFDWGYDFQKEKKGWGEKKQK